MQRSSPQEQSDFLARGRFGEGNPSQMRTAFSRSVTIGLVLIVLSVSIFGAAILLKIGRDDGGPFFVLGSAIALLAGVGCFLWAIIRKATRALRRL